MPDNCPVCPNCKKEYTSMRIWWRRLAWWGVCLGSLGVVCAIVTIPLLLLGIAGHVMEMTGKALKQGAQWANTMTARLFVLAPWILEIETTMARLSERQRENVLRELKNTGEPYDL